MDAIEVGKQNYAGRIGSQTIRSARRKGAIPVALENKKSVVKNARHICFPVAIQIACRNHR
jgi:hypothetical protein